MASNQEITYKKAVAKKELRFKPFRPKSFQPLKNADLLRDEDLLIMENNAERYAFILRQMAYHHLAQGDLDGTPYLVSF